MFRKLFLPLFFINVLCVNLPAEEMITPPPAAEAAPITYKLQLIYLFEGEHTEFIWAVGQSGFKSVAALKEFISKLPQGSILEFQSSCRRTGEEPIISSEQELNEFKIFCESHGITLKYIPAG